ncbi:glycosyltransferase family 2 protein [Serpula lacrymans var. lacrymans S7.9]|uniref:dolichyl-phosphate beta-glucosyltransferase n=1 Tax=Serpula lacrymans var. lacrymans (strain S7.9) TaxID=578457 RepID=F8P2Y3_SERL9|nr:glycosyltransferase family 2 protein [Serpula lacrymans var. lacrymans S7.9]EGO22515.1 glycosyltransferase family 2 protein [Serpula lacrymans var. lacrymans S7.9]
MDDQTVAHFRVYETGDSNGNWFIASTIAEVRDLVSHSSDFLACSRPNLAHLSTPALKKSRTYEILIVDDGSADETSALGVKLAGEYPESDIRVVTLEKNLGKGGAVRHGMLYARGQRLLMVDADGASRFEDLELLWEAMDKLAPKNEPAVVVGSRAHLVKTEAVVKRSFIRNILMYGLHTILRIVGVGHIRDTQCGFKLFTRRAAQQIFPAQHLATWIFDVELLLLAKQLGIPVEEVPVEWHEVAGSKLNVVKDSLQMLRDLLVLRANILLGRWKVFIEVPPLLTLFSLLNPALV